MSVTWSIRTGETSFIHAVNFPNWQPVWLNYPQCSKMAARMAKLSSILENGSPHYYPQLFQNGSPHG